MLQTIESINSVVNNFIWGVPAMICIIGVGLYLSLRTGFIQVRKFPYAIKTTLGRIFKKKEASDGSMTPFQAVCTALAGTVGTGNIAGVAGAIAIGGPGAVFWMWISAILGMCTKFTEVTLAVHFRERNRHGDYVGGPMYYIKNGLGKKWQILAVLYSAFGVLTVFGTGNATQVNTITTAIDTYRPTEVVEPTEAEKQARVDEHYRKSREYNREYRKKQKKDRKQMTPESNTREYCTEYYAKNRERILAQKKKYYQAKKIEKNKKAREEYFVNKEEQSTVQTKASFWTKVKKTLVEWLDK